MSQWKQPQVGHQTERPGHISRSWTAASEHLVCPSACRAWRRGGSPEL